MATEQSLDDTSGIALIQLALGDMRRRQPAENWGIRTSDRKYHAVTENFTSIEDLFTWTIE